MDFRKRRALIKNLIKEREISTQEELMELVAQQGVQATQATISRDLHHLNIIKVMGQQGRTYYAQLQEAPMELNEHLVEAIRHRVESVTTVQFMNVVKTTPNSNFATIVAGKFDGDENEKIVGTIAGNDTFIIISPDEEAAQAVADFINQYL